MEKLQIEYLPIGDLTMYEHNARQHENEDVDAIVNSIEEFNFNDPIGIWGEDNVIVEGHGRLMAAQKLGLDEVPVIRLDHLNDEQRRAYALAHNKTAELSEWNIDLLNSELDNIIDLDMSDFGFDLSFDDDNETEKEKHAKLSEKFLIPPFDIFDARSGNWTDRKRVWHKLINDKAQARSGAVSQMRNTEKYGKTFTSDVSILDPVLSEIICKWFCIPDGKCFDCFAGDTVFGYVSSYLGHQFTGKEMYDRAVMFIKNKFEVANE